MQIVSLPDGVIPAYGEKRRNGRSSQCQRWIHPRIRGKETLLTSVVFSTVDSSPRTGGRSKQFNIPEGNYGLIPTHRGEIHSLRQWQRLPWAHPRIRGKEHSHRDYRYPVPGFIPAYGEKSYPDSRIRWTIRAHPRLRGKERCSIVGLGIVSGSSPRTGEKFNLIAVRHVQNGLIPAHRGKIPTAR